MSDVEEFSNLITKAMRFMVENTSNQFIATLPESVTTLFEDQLIELTHIFEEHNKKLLINQRA
jgi:hypothetical protein